MSKIEVVDIDSPSGESVLTVGGTNSNTVNVEGTSLVLGKSGGTVSVASGATASGFGLFASYAIIADQKTQNTAGGTFTSGDWRTRDLNTEIADPDGIVSISSNQFTLGAGSYLIRWSAPAYHVSKNQTRLYNSSDSSVEGVGSVAYNGTGSSYGASSYSGGSTRVVISGSKTFEIQHRGSATRSSDGFGVSGNITTEQYTTVEIYKEA